MHRLRPGPDRPGCQCHRGRLRHLGSAGPVQPRVETSTGHVGHRRRIRLLGLGVLATISATALGGGLVSAVPPRDREPPRPLSIAEAERLAAIRVTNYRQSRAEVRGTVGAGSHRIEVAGWVDWARPLLHLTVGGPAAGTERGQLQAGPGLVAHRPGNDRSPVDPPATPPPADDWRIRDLPAGSPLDALLDLIFSLGARRAGSAEAVRAGGARWVTRSRIGTTPVDVFQAAAPVTLGDTAVPGTPARTGSPGADTHPPVGPTAPAPTRPATVGGRSDATTPTRPPTVGGRSDATTPTSLGSGSGKRGGQRQSAEPDRPARYWVDRDARLHRLEIDLTGAGPARLDLDRRPRPPLQAVAALGGRAALPRVLRSREAARLTRMPERTRARRGAALTLTLPTVPAGDPATAPAGNLRGGGWVDWRSGVLHLAVEDLDRPGRRILLRADARGVSQAEVPVMLGPPVGRGRPPRPPLTVPAGTRWRTEPWAARAIPGGPGDLDLLLAETLRIGRRWTGTRPVSWLRRDRLGRRPVEVVQTRGALPSTRLRYWLDSSAVLHRIELRTRSGAFAQLDLAPGPAPKLPRPARVTPVRPPR